MKKNTFLLAVSFLVLISSHLRAQNNSGAGETNLQQGKSHVFINDLSVGFGNGRAVGTFGLGYGIFVADYHQLRLNMFMMSYASEYRNYGAGLSYRYYFKKHWHINPYVEIGGGIGNLYHTASSDFTGLFGYGKLEGGISIQVKRFGFDLGIKGEYNKLKEGEFMVMPAGGVSFRF